MTVLDDEIMEQIKNEIRECVLVPYEALYNKYHDVQFSRKHQVSSDEFDIIQPFCQFSN